MNPLEQEIHELEIQKLAFMQARLNKLSHPINAYVPSDNPRRNQKAFHCANNRIRLAKGGNQSGKSLCGAAEVAWWLLGCHPFLHFVNERPRRVWVLTPEYRIIFEGIWRHLRPDAEDYNGMGFLPRECIKKIGAKIPGYDIPSFVEVYWKNTKRISRIDFISTEGGESGRRRVQSAAIDLLAIDEEIDDNIFTELMVRLLATDGRMIITATLVRSEPAVVEIEELAEIGDPKVCVITLDTEENEHLAPEAKRDVISLLSPEEREIRIHGKSRRMVGRIYNLSNDHRVERFTIPDNWLIYNCLDPGQRVFAGLWQAVNPDNKDSYLVAEMYLRNIEGLHQVAEEIERIETEVIPKSDGRRIPDLRLIDPAAKQKLVTGQASVQAQLSQYNILCSPAYNDIESGIMATQDVFANNTLGYPTLRVFQDLQNFFTEIKNYKIPKDRSKTTSNETPAKPLKRKDHLMDCLRYINVYLRFLLLDDNYQYNKPRESHHAKRFGKRFKETLKKVEHPALGTEW
jgi:phage terminase large subunit-like protein